ncbi:hypothetical protein D3C86_2048260 [compost metagenome]
MVLHHVEDILRQQSLILVFGVPFLEELIDLLAVVFIPDRLRISHGLVNGVACSAYCRFFEDIRNFGVGVL